MTENIASKYFREIPPEQQETVDKWRREMYDTLRTMTIRFPDIRKGDLVTINFPATIKDNQFLIAVEQAQKLADELKCEIMIMIGGMTLQHVTVEEMKEAGWIRDPEFNKPHEMVTAN